ncbi:MAG: hypothetical protein VW405_06105, partial [Rhodospirillaceae bacterium]
LRGTANGTYSVSLVDSTITLRTSAGAAIAAGYTIYFTHGMDFTQLVDLEKQGGFYPDTIEDALDRLTLLATQIEERLSRAITLPLAGTYTQAQFEDALVELPVTGYSIDGPASGTTNDFDVGAAGAPDTGSVTIWCTTTGATTITGFTDGYDGRMMLLINDGNSALTISDEAAGSTAANRVTCAGSTDLSITEGGSVFLLYDGVTSRWRPLASGGAGGGN